MAQTAKRKDGSQPPISAHPAFPAIVALWFAALFGIGSLILPGVLFERLLGATPEFSTRLLISAGCAVLGALAGIAIARRVVASQDGNGASQNRVRRAARSERNENPTKRPIVATEELGEEGLGPVVEDYDEFEEEDSQKAAMPGRRRALSVTDDSGPSEYLSSVPVPGEAAANEEVQEGHPEGEGSDFEAPVDTPMSLAGLETSDPASRDESNIFEPAAATGSVDESLKALKNSPDDQTMAGSTEESSVAEDSPPPMFAPIERDAVAPPETPRRFDTPATPFGSAALSNVRDTAGPEDEVPAADPLTFPLPAQDADAPDPELAHNPFANPTIDGEPQGDNLLRESDASAAAQAPFSTAPQAPLEELSIAQLIERFATSLERDRADHAAVRDPAPIEEAAPLASFPAPAADTAESGITATRSEEEDDFASDDAPVPFTRFAEAMSAGDEPDSLDDEADSMPAALRPLDLGVFEDDGQEDEDDPFASGLSLTGSASGADQPFNAPANPFAAPPLQETPEEMSAPAAQPFPSAAMPAEGEIEAGDEVDEEACEEAGYSSLLGMKTPRAERQEFVRVEEEEEDGDEDAPAEEMVVFPGASAVPPAAAMTGGSRPFDTPPNAHQAPGNLPRAVPTTPASEPADPAETEKALREALEKLQRMSGAA